MHCFAVRNQTNRRFPAEFLLAVVMSAFVHCSVAANQPQWGQRWSRNMVSTERGLPASCDPKSGQNIKWVARLGSDTHSTPVVAGGRVFIGTNNGEPRDPRHQGDRGVVMCFEELTGQFLWQLVVPKITNSFYWDWPRMGTCSPATVEGDRVYIVSNRGEVMCLDAMGMANGNGGPFRDEATHCVPPGERPIEPGPRDADIFWLFDLIKELGVRQHDSAHASILVHGRFLYVNTSNGVDDTHKQIHSPEAPSLVVLDKATGRLVARDDERIGPRVFHATWSSPSLGEVEGKPRIFFCGGDCVVYGFEPVRRMPPQGEALKLKKTWQFDPDPTGPKENVHRFNSNRQVGPCVIHGLPVFHHGRIYVTGGGDLWWGKNEAWLKCINATGSGDVTKSATVWSYPLSKHVMSSPAVWNGLVFAADCGHEIHCVDAKTGERCWMHESGAEAWATPLVADGKVYVATRRGELFIFEASRGKKLLAQVNFGSPISATPVAANGTLYIATMKDLYAVKARTQ